MSFQITLRQHSNPVTAKEGETILDAALAAGVPYPHGCQAGDCGSCLSRLHTGTVEMGVYSDVALSPDERDQGFILACRARPTSDIDVAWVDEQELAAASVRGLTGRVISVDAVTHDIKCVRIAIEQGAPMSFIAGQYAKLRFDALPARDYSMASRPEEPALEFHIRKVDGGASSSYVADCLAVGDNALIDGPFGSATLRGGDAKTILAVAGGSGLAPIKSIVETALAANRRGDIHLYFGVRDERDIYLEDHFAALCRKYPNLKFVPVLSSPSAQTERRTGFVHEAIATDFRALSGETIEAYIAGPPVMVSAVTRLLRDEGLPRESIHADAFFTEREKQLLVASHREVGRLAGVGNIGPAR